MRTNHDAIPRVAHRVWIQGVAKLPHHLRFMCWGFDQLHPGWATEWWDHERIMDELDLWPAANLYHQAADIVPADAVNQLRADLARYAILRQHGGLTLDVDYHWMKPIGQLIYPTHQPARPDRAEQTQQLEVVACWETQDRWIANGFLATTMGHWLPDALLTNIYLPATPGTTRPNQITGPKHLTPHLVGSIDDPTVKVLPADLLHPVPWNKPHLAHHPTDYPDSYAVHIWNHQHELQGIPWPA